MELEHQINIVRCIFICSSVYTHILHIPWWLRTNKQVNRFRSSLLVGVQVLYFWTIKLKGCRGFLSFHFKPIDLICPLLRHWTLNRKCSFHWQQCFFSTTTIWFCAIDFNIFLFHSDAIAYDAKHRCCVHGWCLVNLVKTFFILWLTTSQSAIKQIHICMQPSFWFFLQNDMWLTHCHSLPFFLYLSHILRGFLPTFLHPHSVQSFYHMKIFRFIEIAQFTRFLFIII